MPGIISIYTEFAERHVQHLVEKSKAKKISHAKIELQLISQIENGEGSFEEKISWFHAILASLHFESFWEGVSIRHKLPKSCTERYVPDPKWLRYEAPTDDEAEQGAEDTRENADEVVEDSVHTDAAEDSTEDPTQEDADDVVEEHIETDDDAAKVTSPTSVSPTPAVIAHNSRFSSPDCASSETSSSSADRRLAARSVKRAVLPRCEDCKQLGHAVSICPFKDSEGDKVDDTPQELHNLADDPNFTTIDDYLAGVTSEEGDGDSSYEETPAKKKGKGKAKSSFTGKGTSKPAGVMKKKAAPKKKEQTPAQLKQLERAAAKSREPLQPKAIKEISKNTSSQATITPAQSSSNDSNKRSHAATEPDEVDNQAARFQAPIGPAQEAGVKRTREESPASDDDAPATKKAKTGGAAAVDGGRKTVGKKAAAKSQGGLGPVRTAITKNRKKAAPKKSNKKEEEEELKEWDGIPRGFGEY